MTDEKEKQIQQDEKDAKTSNTNKKNKDKMPWIVKVIITLLLVAVGLFLLLFLAAKLIGFNSISELLQHMSIQWNLIIERIFS